MPRSSRQGCPLFIEARDASCPRRKQERRSKRFPSMEIHRGSELWRSSKFVCTPYFWALKRTDLGLDLPAVLQVTGPRGLAGVSVSTVLLNSSKERSCACHLASMVTGSQQKVDSETGQPLISEIVVDTWPSERKRQFGRSKSGRRLAWCRPMREMVRTGDSVGAACELERPLWRAAGYAVRYA